MSAWVLDDVLVVTAELEGLRLLARLPRPKVGVVQEDVPGASCLWSRDEERDLVRLRPRSGVSLISTLRAVHASTLREPGGDVVIRGARSSYIGATDLVARLRGRETLSLPRALMARDLRGDLGAPVAGLSVTVASDAPSLAKLRSVVGQVFAGASSSEVDNEKDFYHAPGVMTYLAVSENDAVVSTGSILIVNGVANIWSVATLPSARGRGAGTAIIEAACVEAKRQGAAVAALRTTDDLARPGGLYDKVGFALVGHERIFEIDAVDHLDLD